MNLLDFLFPKHCVNCGKLGDFLCTDCFSRISFDTKNICLVCGKPSFNGLTHPRCKRKYAIEGSFTGIVFNPVSKKLIYQFKYEPYLSSLAPFLGDLLYESLIQNEEFNKILRFASDDILLVPIPLSASRFRERGYNQAELLAKELSKKFGLPMIKGLNRVKNTKPQFNLNKEERSINIVGAFGLNDKFKTYFKNKNVVLVDDVLTTGSTFSEAAKILKHSRVKEVWAVALAKED